MADTAGMSLHNPRCCPGNSEGQLLREKALERVYQDPGDKVKELEQGVRPRQSQEGLLNNVCSGMFPQGGCPGFTVDLDDSWGFYFTQNPLLEFEGSRNHTLPSLPASRSNQG